MKVAVVTPYYKEPSEILLRCHDSILKQSVGCHHILVSDGHPKDEIDHWDATHIRLPKAHGDYGDTAKSIGAVEAIGKEFDAITFLDADNAFEVDHIQRMLAAAKKTQAGMITCTRTFCRTDGSKMGICENCDGHEFCDTNCMLILKPAFDICLKWVTMPAYGHAICDRIFWHEVKRNNIARTHINHAGVLYYVYHKDIYRFLGEEPPSDADHKAGPIAEALKQWEKDGNPSLRFSFRGHKI